LVPVATALGIATLDGDDGSTTSRRNREASMTTIEDHARTGCVAQEIKFLDLDGDGVLDAVLTVETLGVEIDGTLRSIEQIETLEMQIDIDGTPHDMRVVASRT
jgi:hypothetical protein